MENKVETLRKERNLSQEELGKLLNVSRQTIISIEKKRYMPSLKLAFKIAKVFDQSIEDLFLFDEEEE
jgi:putative transcriptional regulator